MFSRGELGLKFKPCFTLLKHINRPFDGFSTFDMDKLGKIRQLHRKERLCQV